MRVVTVGSVLALLAVCLVACAAEVAGFVDVDAGRRDAGAVVDGPPATDTVAVIDRPAFDVQGAPDAPLATDVATADGGVACTPPGEVPYATHTSREEFTDPPSCVGCPRPFTNITSLDVTMLPPGATTLRVEGVAAGELPGRDLHPRRHPDALRIELDDANARVRPGPAVTISRTTARRARPTRSTPSRR